MDEVVGENRVTDYSYDKDYSTSEVIVNIYDIPSPGVNKFMSATGLSGVYHSGMFVYGKELSFVGHPFTFSGVYFSKMVSSYPPATTIRIFSGATPTTTFCSGSSSSEKSVHPSQFWQQIDFHFTSKESINYGRTNVSSDDFDKILLHAGQTQFRGCDYNIVGHNCNDFTSYLLAKLIPDATLPGWINRLARLTRSFTFIGKLMCDKISRGYYILEMLYVVFLGDVEAIQQCLGHECVNISQLHTAINEAVYEKRIPNAIPFYPILNPLACKKVHRFLNITPSITPDEMRSTITLHDVIHQSEKFFRKAWDIYEQMRIQNTQLLSSLEKQS